MRGLAQDLWNAGRSLRSAPGFTGLVVLILALGIGANVAMFGVFDSALLRPLPYAEPDRLVRARVIKNGHVQAWISAFDYWDFRDRSTSFEHLSALWGFPAPHVITGRREAERVLGVVASVDFFRTLGVDPRLGRHFSDDEALESSPAVAIISHGYWQRRFAGNPNVLGQTLVVDGTPHSVIGVLPPGFHFAQDASASRINPRMSVDIWRPMRPDSEFIAERRFTNWIVIGRIKPGVSIGEAQMEADLISASLEAQYPETNQGERLVLTGLHQALVERHERRLTVLMAAVGLVLLIACGNAAGLLLARGSTRRPELSVRAALGASRLRLVRQLVVESLALAVVAGALGSLLALWLQGLLVEPLLVQMMGLNLPAATGSGLSTRVLLFAIGVTVATGLIFGTVPALRATRGNLVEDLKATARITDATSAKVRSVLVAAQVALSVVLLVGAGLLIRSFTRLSDVDVGFDARNLLTGEVSLSGADYRGAERRIGFYSELRESLQALPGVEDVALVSQAPIRDLASTRQIYAAANPPADPNSIPSACDVTVLPGYFEAMRVPLLAGRVFADSDRRGAPPVVVISVRLARLLFPAGDAVGNTVVVSYGDGISAEVIGVVGDVQTESLSSDWTQTFYSSYFQAPRYNMSFAVRTSVEPGSVGAAVREAVSRIDNNVPIAGLTTMDSVLWRSVASSRNTTLASTVFAALALLLALVGLYSVLVYYVNQRRHEIGVRVALGATTANILELVLRRGMFLVAGGVLTGLLASIGVTRLLKGLLFQTDALDPATYATVVLLFGTIAALACLLPARRALRVDPAAILNTE